MRKSLIAAFGLLALSSAALAQSSSPVIESGGCGNGAASSGNGYFTVDGTLRNCTASSPSTLGWYSYQNINSNSTTTVKATAGVLHSLTINTKGVSPNTLTLFDSTTGSGTTIGKIDTTGGTGTLTFDTNYLTALTAVLSGGTAADVTLTFK